MAKRLWDKGEPLDQQVQAFTVGSDPENDLALVRWDAVASAAHARMLHKIGVLSAEELAALLPALKEIRLAGIAKKFQIPRELEDCHTAIESALVEKTGDAGRKIHTGRSRNDQVLTAQRLYLKDEVLYVMELALEAVETFLGRFHEIGALPMPGYTHFQPAMPASVGMWLAAFAEAFLENIGDGLSLLERLDANPLGAASGFGVPLPLDRAYTAELMGFGRVQRNPIDIQNSRGRYELKVARWLSDIAATVEKFSWDVVLYCASEFGFFSLPNELTTGSSIMPQKRNPDVAELLRGSAARVRGAEQELLMVIAKLPSNYHRDFQLSKEPIMRSIGLTREILPICSLVARSLQPRTERLNASMIDELYATYDAYREVGQGLPFREAYRKTAERLAAGKLDVAALKEDFKPIAERTAQEVSQAEQAVGEIKAELADRRKKLIEVEEGVFTV